jgi:catechol 2,3-dioxygenase-like lactoylglutathione lyase family enzyme
VDLDGVHHVSLNVADAAVAGRFYTEVLGLDVLDRPDFGIPGMWLACGTTQIHLIEQPGHEAPEGQHFAFLVEDIAASRSSLQAAGVEVTEPSEIPGVGRQAFLHDPSGNLIELNQPV